jgi:hypothetical protein
MQSFRCHTTIVEAQPQELRSFCDAVIAVVKSVDSLFTLQLDTARGVYRGEGLLPDKGGDMSLYQPYTVVEVDTLRQIPYCESYAPEIAPVIRELRELGGLSRGINYPGFSGDWWGAYFDSIALGFQQDSWSDVERFFLTLPAQERFLLSIGPIERYHDSRLGCRRFYTAVFMYRNPEYTVYQKLWSDASEEYLSDPDIWFKPRVTPHVPRLFVGDVIAEGGEVAALDAEAWSRPEDTTVAATHGAIKMIMVNTFQRKSAELLASASRTMVHFGMDPDRRRSDLGDLEVVCMTNLILHEMGHTFIKPDGGAERLGEFYTLFEEARAEINSLYLCWKLEGKGLVPLGRTRQVLLTDLALLHYKYQRFIRTGFRDEYLYSTVLWYEKAEQFGLISLQSDGVVHIDESALDQCMEVFIRDIFTFFNTILRFAHCLNVKPLMEYKATVSEKCAYYCSSVRVDV